MTTLMFLVEGTLEFSLIAVVALLATALMKKQSAALRHWVLAAAVCSAIMAPLLGVVLPPWRIPLDARYSDTRLDTFLPAGASAVRSGQAVAATGPDPDASLPGAALEVAVALWAGGAAVHLAILVVGVRRLLRVTARSRTIAEGRWSSAAAAISRAYALRRSVLLLQSDHPSLLVTWGIVHPKVILPRGADEWTSDRIQVVLSHELAHVRRGDWIVQMAAELVRSIYWFNPLAWVVCRRIRQESEYAADDAVLGAGVDGRSYAEQLLEIARAVRRHGDAWSPAPAIVHPSTLERRVTAMLNAHVNRSPLTRSARSLSVAALVALAAAIASAQGALGTFSGAVLDPMNRTLPNATLVLTNVQTGAKHQVQSDESGRFEFAELPRGDYALEVKYPGFMMLRGKVAIAAQNVPQNFNLAVGTLEETITVKAVPGSATNADSPARRGPVPARANDCRPTAHGGNLRPPVKLYDVRPAYPLALANGGVGGTVRLGAVIARDGSIKDVQVTQSAHPDLDAAAIAAVRQWRFDSTLLNCMPIEVTMNVTVTFTTT